MCDKHRRYVRRRGEIVGDKDKVGGRGQEGGRERVRGREGELWREGSEATETGALLGGAVAAP